MPTTTADAPAAAPAAVLTKYAYVLVLQFPLGGMNHAVMENAGVLDLPEGYSRHSALQELRQVMVTEARAQGITANPHTLFFSIERDAL